MKAEAKLVTLSDLERMEGLAAKATPGEWSTVHGGYCGMDGSVYRVRPVQFTVKGNMRAHDADFIASSRTFVPAAISTIRRLVDALTPLVLNEIDCDIAAGVMHRPCIDEAHALLREMRGED